MSVTSSHAGDLDDLTTLAPSDTNSNDARTLAKRKRNAEYQRRRRQTINTDGVRKEIAYYAKNSSHIKARKKARRPDNVDRIMFRSARQRAKTKDLPFNIDYGDIKIPNLCPVFNVPLTMFTKYAPSLDRIKPELGYVKGNVQVISWLANRMKQNATEEELNKFAQWVISTH